METVERRLNAAADEIRMAYQYDYVVVNDALDDAVQELKTIFAAEKLKAANRKKIIDEVLEL